MRSPELLGKVISFKDLAMPDLDAFLPAPEKDTPQTEPISFLRGMTKQFLRAGATGADWQGKLSPRLGPKMIAHLWECVVNCPGTIAEQAIHTLAFYRLRELSSQAQEAILVSLRARNSIMQLSAIEIMKSQPLKAYPEICTEIIKLVRSQDPMVVWHASQCLVCRDFEPGLDVRPIIDAVIPVLSHHVPSLRQASICGFSFYLLQYEYGRQELCRVLPKLDQDSQRSLVIHLSESPELDNKLGPYALRFLALADCMGNEAGRYMMVLRNTTPKSGMVVQLVTSWIATLAAFKESSWCHRRGLKYAYQTLAAAGTVENGAVASIMTRLAQAESQTELLHAILALGKIKGALGAATTAFQAFMQCGEKRPEQIAMTALWYLTRGRELKPEMRRLLASTAPETKRNFSLLRRSSGTPLREAIGLIEPKNDPSLTT